MKLPQSSRCWLFFPRSCRSPEHSPHSQQLLQSPCRARAAGVPILSWSRAPQERCSPWSCCRDGEETERNVEKQLQPLLHPCAGSVRDNSPVFSVIYRSWAVMAVGDL